jgi:hypothetical protein
VTEGPELAHRRPLKDEHRELHQGTERNDLRQPLNATPARQMSPRISLAASVTGTFTGVHSGPTTPSSG